MTKVLALDYRPTKFSDLIGQELNAAVLNKMVTVGSVPSGLLFSGPSGVGKTTAARILAASMNQDEAPIEMDAASNGGVADIRTLTENLRYGHQGEYRIVILDEAHSITRDGFNALLKTLEEPPNGTIFVLCSTEPEKIPETVKSRLIEFEFRRVPSDKIAHWMNQISINEKINISPQLLILLAQLSDGNVRKALNTLDQCWAAEIDTPEKYREMAGISDVAAPLLSAISVGDTAKSDAILHDALRTIGSPHYITQQLTRCLRDLQVIRAGGSIEVPGSDFELRRELALTLEPERVFAAMKTLWDLKTRIRVSDDPLGNLELAISMIEEVFTRGKSIPTHAPVVAETPQSNTPARKLTLAELREK